MLLSRTLEAAVNVAIALVLLWPVRVRLRAVLASIPRRYAVTCIAGLCLLLAGHEVSRGDVTYPLAGWDMYTRSDPSDPRFVEYVAELEGGREEPLLLGELFPDGGRHFRARVDQAAYALDAAAPGERPQAAAHLDTVLDAIALRYREVHAADSVRAIRLWIGSVPAQHYRGPASITRRLLLEYETR